MATNDYGKICEYPCYSLYFTNINTSLLKNTMTGLIKLKNIVHRSC